MSEQQSLALLLSERLAPVLPDVVDVRGNVGRIALMLNGEVREEIGLEDVVRAGGGRAEVIESAVWSVLDKLQDFVIEEAGIQPWPGASGIARAEVRVAGGELRFWYGDEADPTLAFEPIQLRRAGLAG